MCSYRRDRALTEDELLANSQWFEEQDERIFSSIHKIFKWLKEAELNKEEVKSRNSVGSRSSKSRSSKSSRSSNGSSRSSIKDKAIEENFADQKSKMEYVCYGYWISLTNTSQFNNLRTNWETGIGV